MKAEKIKFRKILEKDLAILSKWRNDEKIRDFNNQFFLLNLELQKKWFKSIKQNNEKKMFLVTIKDKPIGVCGIVNIDNYNQNGEIAIIIGEQKFRGKGIGKNIIKKLLTIGFKSLKLHRISADVFEFNKNSQKFFESVGFELEYSQKDKLWRNGQWWNVLTYSILCDSF